MKFKKEIKIAICVIAAIVILVFGINFLKGKMLFESTNTFYGIYDSVDGLKISSVVTYKGYDIGQVQNIQFIGEQKDKVLVEMVVGSDIKFTKTSVASIYSVDLMGTKGLKLEQGNVNDAIAQNGDTLKTHCEANLMESMLPMKTKLESVLNSLDGVMLSVNKVLDEKTDGNVVSTLKYLNEVMQNAKGISSEVNLLLKKEGKAISQILNNVDEITEILNNGDFEKSLANLEEISSSLNENDLSQTVARFDSIAFAINQLCRDVNNGEGSVGALFKDEQLYDNMLSLSDNLDELVYEFKDNPKKFINVSVFGSKNKTKTEYGVVLLESKKRIPASHDLYKEYHDMKELKKNGAYLYIHSCYDSIEEAEKCLLKIQNLIKSAFVVKIEE